MKIYRLLWIALIALAACAPAAAPAPTRSPLSPIVTPDRPMDIAPIQIDKVEVQITESQPVQVSAHVTGIIGDGCSSAMPVEQQRDGNTITLTINRQRPADAICTQIAKIYDETIRLQGDFPAGDYTLKVNTVTQTFTVN
jgi:hypothetical protein